ncbi:hypothetical protein Y032_0144g2439 [Ancylostoma ceylanicum]|uniref:Uncharacterized protein n=1 Tax=Ancylostoma ceylanicum TaxID=53326 RepID=A0A016T306_9BILA|nr:hypothetical protein Y032_0144g2439 [Ancylostoma ceylanicum]
MENTSNSRPTRCRSDCGRSVPRKKWSGVVQEDLDFTKGRRRAHFPPARARNLFHGFSPASSKTCRVIARLKPASSNPWLLP